jgi:hypothetical protein
MTQRPGRILLLLPLLALPAWAQIVPVDKRAAAVAQAAKLAPVQDDEFEARLTDLRSPFHDVQAEVAADPAVGRNELRELLRKSLRLSSGIFTLPDGRQSVFINSRRLSPGETLRVSLSGRDAELRLVTIGPRSITVEIDSLQVELPTR